VRGCEIGREASPLISTLPTALVSRARHFTPSPSPSPEGEGHLAALVGLRASAALGVCEESRLMGTGPLPFRMLGGPVPLMLPDCFTNSESRHGTPATDGGRG